LFLEELKAEGTKKGQNGSRGNQKRSMDRTRRSSTDLLRGIVRRPTMGFHSQSFRFEGGGRQIIGMGIRRMKGFHKNHLSKLIYFVGLKRTGKSCRLRWVNYLHPGLKRGKMTPHEEKLVLELHAQWGNRYNPCSLW